MQYPASDTLRLKVMMLSRMSSKECLSFLSWVIHNTVTYQNGPTGYSTVKTLWWTSRIILIFIKWSTSFFNHSSCSTTHTGHGHTLPHYHNILLFCEERHIVLFWFISVILCVIFCTQWHSHLGCFSFIFHSQDRYCGICGCCNKSSKGDCKQLPKPLCSHHIISILMLRIAARRVKKQKLLNQFACQFR